VATLAILVGTGLGELLVVADVAGDGLPAGEPWATGEVVGCAGFTLIALICLSTALPATLPGQGVGSLS